ncbi:MAG: nitroreductase family protein [Merdibacter sp.]
MKTPAGVFSSSVSTLIGAMLMRRKESDNEILELIKTRRSVRLSARHGPRELIDQIVEAGLYAPSGMNRQPVIIIAVSDPRYAMRSRLNASIMGTDDDPFTARRSC